MSFWRRWLRQWGYVRIRDYGLIVTDAGQVIRVADGVVVNDVAPPLAPPSPERSPAPPAPQLPPAPAPVRDPTPPPASVEPAPAFALPAPVAPEPPRPTRPVRRSQPPAVSAAPSRQQRTASGSVPPPVPGRARRADATVPDDPPSVSSARRPLPRLAGRPRIPPRQATETTTTTGTDLTDSFSRPGDEVTVVDDPPRDPAPLPRLSARLAARRKG